MVDSNSSSVLKNVTEEEKYSIFTKGTLLNIKHSRIFEGMLNVIQDYKDDIIYVKLTEPFIKGNILIGDKVKCQILSNEYEYTVFAEVYHIDISSPGIVKIQTNRVYKYQNIRRDKRYLVNFRANILKDIISDPVYAIVKNISLSGMAVVCNHKFQTLIDVKIKFSTSLHTSEYIETTANIIRESSHEGYNEYGLMFLDMGEKNKEALKNLINNLENKKITLLDS